MVQQDELKSTIQSVFSKYFDVTEIEVSYTTSKNGGKTIYDFRATIYK